MIEKERFAKIVGDANVIDDQAILKSYASDFSFIAPTMPGLVVKVSNLDEIQKIVNLARETKTPLIPVSSCGPHFNGDTVPTTGGAVIVDLSGMKKIIRVDRINRTVMFEPGVNFEELIDACRAEGMRLNIPLLPRKTKSVSGSLLERQPVTMPGYHWDIGDPLNCMEIIFGTGEAFRTGSAAGPGTLEEQWAAGGGQVLASGPTQASWYRMIGGAQGTMGIAGWTSARCEILPRLQEPYMIGCRDINQVLEMTRWLVRLRIPNECFILNKTALAAMMAIDHSRDYMRIFDSLPEWVLFYNLAGYEYFPEERIQAHEEDVWKLAQKNNLIPARAVGEVNAFDLLKAVQSVCPEPYWKLRAKGASHEIPVLSNFQNVDKIVLAMYQAAGRVRYPTNDLGVYIQPLVQGANYHIEFTMFYDPDSAKEKAIVHKFADVAVGAITEQHGFFSRPYGEHVKEIINRDAATRQSLDRVKNMFDPDRIMNPGKLCF